MAVLSSNGFALVNSYSSSTAGTTSVDINFDSPNGADKQIITGSFTFVTDGSRLRYKAFDSAQNAVTSRTMSSRTTSTWSLNNSTGNVDLHYFTAGNASGDTSISGERTHIYMEVNLGNVESPFFYEPNIMCKTTEMLTNGLVYTAVSNAQIHFGDLEYIRIDTNAGGFLAYNLKQYSLAHTGK